MICIFNYISGNYISGNYMQGFGAWGKVAYLENMRSFEELVENCIVILNDLYSATVPSKGELH